MLPITILAWVVIGAIAGYLAGQLVRGHGFGLLGNVIVGIVGAVVGGVALTSLGLISDPDNIIAEIIAATVGAVILLALLGLIRKK